MQPLRKVMLLGLNTWWRGANFSDDRVYRYRLWRQWERHAPVANFLMLNPSYADEKQHKSRREVRGLPSPATRRNNMQCFDCDGTGQMCLVERPKYRPVE